MMKTCSRLILIAPLLLGPAAVAHAQSCTGGETKDGSALSGMLVCANKSGGAGDPMQRWSEIHNTTTGSVVTLGEHGRGSNDPAGTYDADIGTWSYSGSSVTYDYTGDGNYTFVLYGPTSSDPTVFCTGEDGTVVAEIKEILAIPAATDPNPCNW